MKTKRFLSLLLILGILLSMFPMTLTAGATDADEDKRPTRSRESYTHYTDEQLMDMLHLTKTKFKTLKQSLRDAILNNTSCSVASLKIPYDEDAKTAIRGLVYYHPEYFFVATISYSTVKSNGNKVISRISFKYEEGYETGIRKYRELEAAAEEILCPIRGAQLSQLEQALLVHDFLAVNSEYDRKAASGEDRYTAYGAIVNRLSVCQGYTEAYAYLLGKLGIPVNLCKSDELNHAWNIVELDGKAYNVDVTWDDPTIDHAGYTRHVNFLRSTQGMIEEGHEAEDFTAITTDTEYDSAFWQKSTSKFCLLGDTIYFLSGGKLYSWKDGNQKLLYKLSTSWKPYVNRFDYLATDGEDLFFSAPDAIYRFDVETKKAAVFYKPDLSKYNNFKIYGFTIRENKFYLDVYNTPNFNEETREKYQIVYTYRKDVASAHRFDEGKVVEKATCTEDGEILYTCLGCGFTKNEVLAAPGHKLVTDKAVAATCAVSGLTKGEHCSTCNAVLTAQEVVPAKGHNYVNNICKTCGDQPSSAPTANSFRADASGKYVLAVKIGSKYYAIPNALPTKATKINGVEIPVSGGTVSSSNASAYALTLTWTEDGYTIENNGTYLKYTSSTNVGTSDEPYFWNISKGTNGSWRVSPSTAGTRALVYRAKTYNLFGAYTASNATVDSTEHYDLEILPVGSGSSCKHSRTIEETVAATCTASGSTCVKCKSCGEVLSATTTPATGHKRVTDKAVAATCTEPGLSRGYHCSLCGKVTTAQKEVPATGHSFTDGKCSVCGAAEVVAAPFKSGASGTFVIAAKVGDIYYAMPNSLPGSAAKLRAGEITVKNGVVSASDAEDYALTLKYSSGKYSILSDGVYLKYASSTNLTSTDSSYNWTITKGTNGSWRVTSKTTTRGLVFRAGNYDQFGAYLLTSVKAGGTEYFDLEILPVEAAEAGCSHKTTTVTKRAASCKADGSDTVTCQDCGEVVSSSITPALGHDFSTQNMRSPGSAATCTADGYQNYCCSRCAETTATVIASNGHTEVVDAAIAPTCTTFGMTEGSHCADCNAVLVEQQILPMLVHSYVGGSCTICGEEQSVVTPFEAGQSGQFVLAAKVDGTYYALSDEFPASAGKAACGMVTAKNGSILPAAAEGYTLTLTYTDGAYTIESNGSYLKYASSTNLIASADPYAWTLSQGVNGKWRLSPAEASRGLIFRGGEYNQFGAYAMSNATEDSQEYFDLEILSIGVAAACLHEDTESTTVEATCTQDGSITEVCLDCEKIVNTQIIPALGHTEVTDEGREPTCTQPGLTEGSHCSLCNEILIQQEVIPTLMHYYEDGICTSCGSKEPVVEPFCEGQSGSFVLAAKVGTDYYALPDSFPTAAGRISGMPIEAKNGSVPTNAAQGFIVTLTYENGTYTIESNGSYLKYASSTNLVASAEPYAWTLTQGVNGKWRLIPQDDSRVLAFRAGEYSTFGAYASSNVNAGSQEFFDLQILSIGVPSACLHEDTVDVVTDPTCTEDGLREAQCSSCGLIVATEVIPATGHTEEILPAVAPSCTQTGLTEGKCCSVCDAVVEAQIVVPMLDHSYENGSCSLCGAQEPKVKPFQIGMSGSFVLAAKVGDSYYSFSNVLPTAAGKLSSVALEVVDGAVSASAGAAYAVNLSYADGVYTIDSNGSYLKHASSTNLNSGEEAYSWVITQGTNGSWRITSEEASRALIYRAGEYNVFGAYATSNVKPEGKEYFDLEILPLTDAPAPVVDESIVINHNLNLASDIAINFAVKTNLLESYDSFYLECVVPQYEGNELTGSTTLKVAPVLNGNYYYFTLTGLTAVQMGDEVEATLHMTKDGAAYVSNPDVYSVAKYAYTQLAKTDGIEKLKTLCAELLRYGAAAQSFKSYRMDHLVDGDMTEAHKSYLRDLNTVTFGNNNTVLDDLADPAVLWKGKSLDLDSRVCLKFVVSTENYSGKPEDLALRITFVNYKGDVQTVTLTEPTRYRPDEPWYAFSFDGLLAAELRCVVDAAVYEGDTRVSQTLRYSADTYGNGKTGSLLTLCKALIAYSDTALDFFS